MVMVCCVIGERVCVCLLCARTWCVCAGVRDYVCGRIATIEHIDDDGGDDDGEPLPYGIFAT